MLRAVDMYEGKQKAKFFAGISAESVGASGLCMHLVTIPSGGTGAVHLHEDHETALFVGNLHASEPVRAVLARTDPNEQESVVLLTEGGDRHEG